MYASRRARSADRCSCRTTKSTASLREREASAATAAVASISAAQDSLQQHVASSGIGSGIPPSTTMLRCPAHPPPGAATQGACGAMCASFHATPSYFPSSSCLQQSGRLAQKSARLAHGRGTGTRGGGGGGVVRAPGQAGGRCHAQARLRSWRQLTGAAAHTAPTWEGGRRSCPSALAGLTAGQAEGRTLEKGPRWGGKPAPWRPPASARQLNTRDPIAARAPLAAPRAPPASSTNTLCTGRPHRCPAPSAAPQVGPHQELVLADRTVVRVPALAAQAIWGIRQSAAQALGE